MIYDYQIVLGVFAALLTFVAFFLYVRSALREGTKPHPFTWFLITIIDTTVFVAQVLNGGGPGTWAVGTGAALSGIVFLIALIYGEKRIARIDWICLALALFGIAIWITTSNALLAVVFASITDVLVKLPTFRKSYIRPNEESITMWSVDIVLYSLSIGALSTLSWTTALFPAVIVINDIALVAMILFRRKQLAAVVRPE